MSCLATQNIIMLNNITANNELVLDILNGGHMVAQWLVLQKVLSLIPAGHLCVCMGPKHKH